MNTMVAKSRFHTDCDTGYAAHIKPPFVHYRPKNTHSLTGINARRAHRPILIIGGWCKLDHANCVSGLPGSDPNTPHSGLETHHG